MTSSERTDPLLSEHTSGSADSEEVFVLPASLGQERFWGLDRQNPGNPTWNVPVRFRLQGPLNVDFLERAFNEIVRRHETLRTIFTVVDNDQPAQVVKPSLDIQVPVTDLRHLSQPERDAEADRLSFQEARWRFDLAKGPLFRVSLLRVSDDEHVMLVTPHHTVIDYWSVGLISNELGALYDAYSRGVEPLLPELPIQYADFAIWQREQALGPVVQKELVYWNTQLKDLPLLEFPTDHARGSFPTFDATITSILLPVKLTDAIREIATREGATFFNTMLAALSMVLQHYSGQTDFGVATQVAGRTNVETERLIGMFINTVVLRMDLSDDPTFAQLLSRVQETGLQAIAHQNVRFEQLLKELRPRDYPSHHTLFRLNFICQRDPVKPLEFSGIKLTVIPSKCQGALYDLNVFLVLRNEGWRLACEYNTDLCEASTITRLLGDYKAMLEQIAENPLRHVSEFPLSEGARRVKERNHGGGTPSGPVGGGATPSVASGKAPDAAAPSPTARASADALCTVATLPEAACEESYALPASEAQRRFWLLEEIAPGDPALHMRACVRLTGALDVPRLEESLQVLMRRHEILRTSFAIKDGELLEIIAPSRKLALAVTSLEEAANGKLDTKLREAIRTETSATLDLARGPLIRARLFRLASQEHVLVLTTHHILVDGWSQNVMQRDLWTIYEALGEGREACLPSLSIQYGDFAHWQREWLASDQARNELDYWRKQLAPPLPVVNMPTDRPPRNRPARDGAMETLLLPDDLIRSLKSLSQSENVTMFMSMLAGYSALLHRYTGQDDLVIGSPVANRKNETEALIGPFAGPVALRLNLSGDPTVRELLDRIREVTLEALGHTDLPFEVVLEQLQIRSIHGRNPLTQCYFFYQTAFLQPRELRELTVTPLPDFALGTHFELQMGLLERREGVRAQLEYNPDLFEPGTIREVLSSYELMLRSFVDDPERHLSDLFVPELAGRTAWRPASPPPKEYVAPRDPVETKLAEIWTELLGADQVGIHDDFFDLGGQSILATQAVSRIRDAFEADLSLQTFFAHATIAELASVVTAAKGTGTRVQRISRQNDSGPRPASFSQERLWFLDQLTPRQPIYNIVDVMRFAGALNKGAIGRALNELVRRHETLRTAFSKMDGRPMQIVSPAIELPLREADLTAVPEQERESAWVKLAKEDGRIPFDLSNAPLIRVTLIKLRPEEHLLVATVHHIISDEWSIEILRRELRALYEAFSQGLGSPLPELPIQYADFASWQRNSMKGELLEKQISYWKEQLAGAPAVLELPTDKPRPPAQTFRGATELFDLPSELLDALKDLGRQEEATLFMTLAASFAVLLHRYTGQDDILLGTPVSGRTRSEIEGLVGLFLNTVVLRARFSDNPSFRSLLRQVRGTALGAYANQDLPFGSLIAELAPKRHLSHTPLFQVMFSLHSEDETLSDRENLNNVASARQLDTETSKFDLLLSLFQTEGRLAGLVEYSTDLFEADTIRRLCGHMRTLLESAVSAPETPVLELPMLTAPEEYRSLEEWNQTSVRCPDQSRCLHELIEEQAERTPDQIALVFAQEQLTYRELNERASRLANYLRRHAVGRDVLVGVYMERSIEMVVTLLGILKAGGAYVPLDPMYPLERISFVLRDASVAVLLTQQKLAQNLPDTGARLVSVDAEWEEVNREGTDASAAAVSPDDLAYVIYTSGSTGNPKGVEIQHRAVVNLLTSMRKKPGLDAQDTLVAVTTLSFDIAALELFLPLCVGAKLVIASRESATDGDQLLALLIASGATVMQATPVTWKLLLEAGWNGYPRLRVLCGGEAFPRELANKLVKRASSVWNMYGPTETTIWSAAGEVQAGEGAVPIGPPIDNTQFYVLDAKNQLVPIGVPGELHIGGAGLARGYFRRPELTAERFICVPFISPMNARVYKTGDLVRRLPDGGIEFLGRLDHQVKLRGFRIELGEIELLLTQHPGVSQAVVLLHRDPSGEERLVAYVVPEEINKCKPVEMRDFLRRKLPEYMVPAAFVVLPRLPLLPNGKVDRKALPTLNETEVQESHAFAPASTPIEKELLAIWQEVLGVKNIGIRDNFFDRGGHSLTGVRLFAQIEKVLNVRLPLSTLFEAQTIEQLARIVEHKDAAPDKSPLVAIHREGSHPRFFCVHGAGGNVLIYRALSQRLGSDQPFYGLQSQGMDGERPPLTRIEDMAALFVQEIRRVQPQGPYFLGGYCMGGTIAFEMAQQLIAEGQRVALLALFDTRNWANLRPDTIWDKVYYSAQKLLFHAANFLLLNLKDKAAFFRQKLDVLGSRSTVWRGRLLGQLKWGQHDNKSEPLLLAQVWEINDKAIRSYVPRPYPGVITDFRPMKQYTKLEEPGLEWDELALGGQAIVTLPVYPAGMLLEPFVKHLANALREAIDKAV